MSSPQPSHSACACGATLVLRNHGASALMADAGAAALIHALRSARQLSEQVRMSYIAADHADAFTGENFIDPVDLRVFETQLQGAWSTLDELADLLDRAWSAASPAPLRCTRRCPDPLGVQEP